jgi:SAM-dependent methyltransferase
MGNPLFVRSYARRSTRRLSAEIRPRVDMLEGLRGRVLEIGCGHGLNFALYPPEVTEVVAIEPDRYLFMRAQQESWEVRVRTPIRVIKASDQDLEGLGLGRFDAVIFSLVLCSLPYPATTLAVVAQLLGPGGQVRFYEHHLATEVPWLAARQHRWSRVWVRCMGGCHPDRDTVALIRAEFRVTWTKEYWDPNGPPGLAEITAPHTVGHAVVPL